MRLYVVALITWAITITASSESNSENLRDEKLISYTVFHDSPTKQIVQSYVTGIEARNSGQTNANDYSDDAANAGLNRSTKHSDTKGTNDASTTDSSSTESIYTISFTETTESYPFREYPSHKLRYTIPEDVLLVENAGSFGQRVQQGHTNEKNTIKIIDGRQDNEHASSQKSFSNTISPLENDNNHRRSPYASSTREPFVFAIKQESNLTDDSSFDDHFEIIGSKTSTRNSDGIFDIRSTTENLSAANTNIASILENGIVPESLSMSQARSSRAHNITTNEITKKNTESMKESESIAKTSTSVKISPSLQLGKFSGPIVVPELPNRETQDVAIDYLDDNEGSGMLKSVGNTGIILESDIEGFKGAASNSITTSSIMLNPLQVGITLVNTYVTDLMDDSEQSAATDTKDYLRDDLQRLVDKKFIKNNGNQSYVNYKDEKFQGDEEKKPVETVTQKDSGNSVEIQKSVELYHTAPIHEIHYPVEYIQQTSNLGIIEMNNIGSSQRSKQSYGQDEPSESRQNYDIYRGNDQDEKSVIKVHASALSQNHNQDEYNALENDTGKPMISTLVAEYSSSTHEQTPFNRYNDVQPIFLVPNQFDDALYDQSNVQHSFNSKDNGVLPHTKPTGSFTRQEIANEHVKPYVLSTYRKQQPQSNHPIDYQHSFRSSEATRRPETPQFLLKIIPNGSSVDGGFLVPIPRPYPIEKVVEKTVHVSHPIEIEKVIEKKVPYPVERVVEKQVQIPVQVPVPLPQPIPQPYPVQVPIDRIVEKQIHVPHLYPIHIERVVEKRVPYTIQQLLVQPPPPYPLHAKVPTAYPAHVPPTHVSTSIEKAKRPAASSRPPRPYDNSGTIETKFNKHQQKSREPVSSEENANFRGGSDSGGSGVDGFPLKSYQNEENALLFYSSSTDPYGKPLTYDYNNNINVGKSYIPAAHYSNVRFMILPKKSGGHVMLRSHVNAETPVSFRRHIILHNLVDKDKMKDEYVGPAPPRKTSQTFPQSKLPQSATSAIQSSAASVTLRRSRQPETQYPGSFRQSKMEYGFKPPMVPSVQYDENTASKVEN